MALLLRSLVSHQDHDYIKKNATLCIAILRVPYNTHVITHDVFGRALKPVFLTREIGCETSDACLRLWKYVIGIFPKLSVSWFVPPLLWGNSPLKFVVGGRCAISSVVYTAHSSTGLLHSKSLMLDRQLPTFWKKNIADLIRCRMS